MRVCRTRFEQTASQRHKVVGAVEFHDRVIIDDTALRQRLATRSGLRDAVAIAAIIYPVCARCGIISAQPETDIGVHASWPGDSGSNGEIVTILQQRRIESCAAIYKADGNFCIARAKRHVTADEQVTLAALRYTKHDIRIVPVGFVYLPDARHAHGGVQAGHWSRECSSCIIIAPYQIRIIAGNGLCIGTAGRSDGIAQSNRDQVVAVHRFRLLLVQVRTIVTANAGDIIAVAGIVGSSPHTGCAIAGYVIRWCCLIERNAVFE